MTKDKQCRICKKPVSDKYKPFCSKRCADVDLGKWLNESYTVAGDELNELTENESEDENI